MQVSSRLAGLDGIRGVAALFVVLHHIYLRSFGGYPATTGPAGTGWLIYGHFAVAVFIVLSGFSLAVAPARSGWRLDDLSRYASRRVRRILPPYWAALAFSLAVAWLVIPQPGQPEPDRRSIVVHGLLLQDALPATTPNRALWSIAIEAHLYLLFPVLLLLVRRAGALLMVGTVTAVVATVGVLARDGSTMDWLVRMTPQFAVLFAIGVFAAGVLSSPLARLPWHWFALAAAVPVLSTVAWQGSNWALGGRLFWVDLALGPAIGCLLAAVATGRPAPLVRLLDTRPLRRLGSFSYSLYLTHAPIVVVVSEYLVLGHVRQGLPSLVLTMAIAVPLTIAFARLFATFFEYPFTTRRYDRQRAAAVTLPPTGASPLPSRFATYAPPEQAQ